MADGLAFVTDEATDVKNVDPALSASITFQVKGFVLVFSLLFREGFLIFVLQDLFGYLTHHVCNAIQKFS